LKKLRKKIHPKHFAPAIYRLASVIGRSLKLEVREEVPLDSIEGGKILAGWHGQTFLPAIHFRDKGIWTIISLSRDGEMQYRIFKRFGFNIIRGSTGRNGIRAAVEAMRKLREGCSMAFTPDGPRGPTRKVQDGILHMAQKTGVAIIPCGNSACKAWRAKSWDRYMIPKFGSKALMLFGPPIYIDPKSGEDGLNEARAQLEAEIDRLQDQADREMGSG